MDTSFCFSFFFGKYFSDKFYSLNRIKINSSCCLNRFNHKGGGRFVFNYGQLFAIEREKRKKNIIIVLGIISRPRSRLTPVIELESER